MSKKAIFAQTEQISWVDVAAKLRDQYGWEICYFIGGKKQSKKAAALFPNTVFHTKDMARKNRWPSECDHILSSPLDKTLLSAMSFHESIFLKMLDRNDFDGSFTYHKRIAMYHSQVMYWKGVLEYFKPDVVVYRVAPHASYDYILYALCRIMNISTVMFERTSLPGFLYPVSSFEDGSATLRTVYARILAAENCREISLTPEAIGHLNKLSKSYVQAMPYHLKYKLEHHKNGGNIGGPLSIFLYVAKGFIRGLLNKRGNFKYLNERYHEALGLFKRKKLFVHYNRLANEVNLTIPYIFVALQCEPERQTCPAGGVFGHQYIMIDLLAKLLPYGWRLYVKEHISQFKDYQAAERSKNFDFYNMIASKDNVEIVPLSYSSFELIDHAKASATVSGTVGWESVVRGKPALLFGHSWYRDCRGVFVVHSIKDCKDAIKKIQDGFQVKRNELICFAKAVESCSIRGYIDKFYEKINIVSPEENVSNLAKTINEFVFRVK